MIRVDDTTFQWSGPIGTATNLTNITITPTRTIITVMAGPMMVNVTYLSPIEASLFHLTSAWRIMTCFLQKPADLVRQSMPFSYVYVEATSLDGKAHHVQVYSDVSGGNARLRMIFYIWYSLQDTFLHRMGFRRSRHKSQVEHDSDPHLRLPPGPKLWN
jgi:hypothetical protein